MESGVGSMTTELEAALAEAREVVFVCSGNMVRSAFAELYARHRNLALPSRSVGTRFRNDRIYPETARALLERGVPDAWVRDFRPTHVNDDPREIGPHSIVFGMRTHHLRPFLGRAEVTGRPFLLSAILGESREIADPVLEGADFAETFEEIARCVDRLVDETAPRSGKT